MPLVFPSIWLDDCRATPVKLHARPVSQRVNVDHTSIVIQSELDIPGWMAFQGQSAWPTQPRVGPAQPLSSLAPIRDEIEDVDKMGAWRGQTAPRAIPLPRGGFAVSSLWTIPVTDESILGGMAYQQPQPPTVYPRRLEYQSFSDPLEWRLTVSWQSAVASSSRAAPVPGRANHRLHLGDIADDHTVMVQWYAGTASTRPPERSRTQIDPGGVPAEFVVSAHVLGGWQGQSVALPRGPHQAIQPRGVRDVLAVDTEEAWALAWYLPTTQPPPPVQRAKEGRTARAEWNQLTDVDAFMTWQSVVTRPMVPVKPLPTAQEVYASWTPTGESFAWSIQQAAPTVPPRPRGHEVRGELPIGSFSYTVAGPYYAMCGEIYCAGAVQGDVQTE